MKKDIHPEFKKVSITCSCGNVIETYSNQEINHVEICSACHPFFTGKQKLIDTEGRVDRFKKRWAKKDEILKKKDKGPRTITIN